jgi:hypothetical protein
VSNGYQRADLDALRDAEEVEIASAATEAGPWHRAIIWVVVDDRDRVLIRSFRGASARWYREVMARPDCRILVGDRMIEVRAVPAADEESIAACSEGLRHKYAGQPSMPAMVRDYLDTTLELVPR